MVNRLIDKLCLKDQIGPYIDKAVDLFISAPQYLYIPSILHCLACLWFLCAVKVFFDLDMLKILPANLNLNSYGKGRRPTVAEQLAHEDGSESAVSDRAVFQLNDFKYHNNVLDLYVDLVNFGKDGETKSVANAELSIFVERFLLIYLSPILQAVTAAMVLVYFMSLLFSYEELFGRSKPDEPVILSDSDIATIQTSVDEDK